MEKEQLEVLLEVAEKNLSRIAVSVGRLVRELEEIEDVATEAGGTIAWEKYHLAALAENGKPDVETVVKKKRQYNGREPWTDKQLRALIAYMAKPKDQRETVEAFARSIGKNRKSVTTKMRQLRMAGFRG